MIGINITIAKLTVLSKIAVALSFLSSAIILEKLGKNIDDITTLNTLKINRRVTAP